jgi:hypothetical protein
MHRRGGKQPTASPPREVPETPRTRPGVAEATKPRRSGRLSKKPKLDEEEIRVESVKPRRGGGKKPNLDDEEGKGAEGGEAVKHRKGGSQPSGEWTASAYSLKRCLPAFLRSDLALLELLPEHDAAVPTHELDACWAWLQTVVTEQDPAGYELTGTALKRISPSLHGPQLRYGGSKLDLLTFAPFIHRIRCGLDGNDSWAFMSLLEAGVGDYWLSYHTSGVTLLEEEINEHADDAVYCEVKVPCLFISAWTHR